PHTDHLSWPCTAAMPMLTACSEARQRPPARSSAIHTNGRPVRFSGARNRTVFVSDYRTLAPEGRPYAESPMRASRGSAVGGAAAGDDDAGKTPTRYGAIPGSSVPLSRGELAAGRQRRFGVMCRTSLSISGEYLREVTTPARNPLGHDGLSLSVGPATTF